jgi:hypothetical protein
MKRTGLAVILGAVLGAFDGLTAWFEPSARPQLGFIVFASSLKSVFAGLLIALFARFVSKTWALALFGFAIGLLLAYLVAMNPDPTTGQHYYAQIMVPGALVGLIVGWATARYGDSSATKRA